MKKAKKEKKTPIGTLIMHSPQAEIGIVVRLHLRRYDGNDRYDVMFSDGIEVHTLNWIELNRLDINDYY